MFADSLWPESPVLISRLKVTVKVNHSKHGCNFIRFQADPL